MRAACRSRSYSWRASAERLRSRPAVLTVMDTSTGLAGAGPERMVQTAATARQIDVLVAGARYFVFMGVSGEVNSNGDHGAARPEKPNRQNYGFCACDLPILEPLGDGCAVDCPHGN